MPTYIYSCNDGHLFEVVKRVADIDAPETCQCGKPGHRQITAAALGAGVADWDKTAYCPVMGQVVKSDKHRRQLARQRGWEEVGNESVAKVQKENDRIREREAEKSYDDAGRLAYNEFFSK